MLHWIRCQIVGKMFQWFPICLPKQEQYELLLSLTIITSAQQQLLHQIHNTLTSLSIEANDNTYHLYKQYSLLQRTEQNRAQNRREQDQSRPA